MSEDKLKRRRFLADILFAGGALTAAALLTSEVLAKNPQISPTPGGTKSPSPTPQNPTGKSTAKPPDPHLGGAPMPPRTPRTPQPNIKGEAVAPRARVTPQPSSRLEGDVAPPRPPK